MVCRVRYLSSAGIHRREIPGIGALALAYSTDWLLYASLQCFPVGELPIEMDAMIVTGDRVLILELKDFGGKLTHNGDQWRHKRRTFRSPVQITAEKARKVKSFLQANIPGFSYLVDFRVVITGGSSKDALSDAEKPLVWTLQEAVSLSTMEGRRALLSQTKLNAKKAFALEAEFERVTSNARMFGPLEAEWDGYRVVEEDFVVHPDKIWREHRGEQTSDSRFKALIRIWSFDKLPAGLNSPERRRFIAGREMRAIGRLHDLGSFLIDRNAILPPIGEEKEEVLTQHFELRRLTAGFTTLDRYLERASEDLDLDDRVSTAASLLTIIAELHAQDIAHRDLGSRSIWAASPTRLALAGLMTCQLPDEESIADWTSVLRGHADHLPEDSNKALAGSAKQRDVHALGRLTFQILTGSKLPMETGAAMALLPAALPEIGPWFARSTSPDAKSRYANAGEMADGFAAAVDQASTGFVDHTLIDLHETSETPYFLWPRLRKLKGNNVYVGQDDASEIVVKTWPRIRRGANAATDAAMTRLFDGVGRLISSPLPGLPRYVQAGLADTGPFVAYRFETGSLLNDVSLEDLETAVPLCTKLVQCIIAIHAMGHFHGDISPNNILVCEDRRDLRLLDLFDMTDVGDGRISTPAMAPDNRDALTDVQLDRYATTKIVRGLLAKTTDGDIAHALDDLDRELARARLETLDPVLAMLRGVSLRLEAGRSPRIAVSFKGAGKGPFIPDGGQYYLRAETLDSTTVEYNVFGIERELTLHVRNGEITHVRYSVANFTHLSYASQHGVPVRLRIDVAEGADAGLEELLTHITSLVGPSPQEHEGTSKTAAPVLDVARYWRKLLELESALQPEVEILQDIGPPSGPVAVYAYERLGLDFDFDAGTTVEVRMPNGRKIGEVNLEQTDAQRLVVDYSDRRLVPGDRVNLVDRRSRSSLDRRTKAVDRILDGDAAIAGLIDYFETNRSLEAVNFGEEVTDEVLDRYRLNRGQRNAFRHVIGHGPVGLLQGPPGTGKTHFIASLVHWLTTEKGARKILIASQSHEAVNNAIEALLDLFKRLGGRRPSLLRIGSKGISEKIRPYHTAAVQERFQSRFENAFRHRVGGLGSAVGLKRGLVADAVDIDRDLGERVRRLKTLTEAESAPSHRSALQGRDSQNSTIRAAVAAFSSAAQRILGRPADPSKPEDELDAAFATLLIRHPDISPSDVTKARHLIELSRDWSASLASPHRNFEEFLAKTRAIVTATCVGVGQTKIRVEKNTYDWVIVDEAARCTPGELAVPIQLGRRVLLVGDHRQLLPMTEPSVIKALRMEMQEIPRAEFERSDFERAYLSHYGEQNGRTLTEQYRMAPAICDLVSRTFYEPHGVKLLTSDDREPDAAFARLFCPVLSAPVTWIDTSDDVNSAEKPAIWDETTYTNDAEVEAITRVLERIAADTALVEALASSRNETPIGVICMYSAQKILIEEVFARRPWDIRFRRMVRIDTVDSYQGKENTIVIVSLVRCNDHRDQGHVRIPNRCNVALSRAKERLFVVGAVRMWSAVAGLSPMRKVLDSIQAGALGLSMMKTGDI